MMAAAFLLWLPASFAIWKAGLINVGYGILLFARALDGAASAIGIGVALTHHSFRLTPREKSRFILPSNPYSMVRLVHGADIRGMDILPGARTEAKG